MIRLVLIRHGQTKWNMEERYQGQSDIALSEEGMKQAKKLAEHFPAERLDAIYASDLQRATKTAEIIARPFGLSVQCEEAFRELSFGAWEGLTYEEIVQRWPKALENFFQHPDMLQIPQGETFRQVQDRAMNRLNAILQEEGAEEKTIAIVAHGAILRTILTAQLCIPLRCVWRIRQFNTAVNIVRYDDFVPTVELMNGTAHLQMDSE